VHEVVKQRQDHGLKLNRRGPVAAMKRFLLMGLIVPLSLSDPLISVSSAAEKHQSVKVIGKGASAEDIARSFVPEGLIPENIDTSTPAATRGFGVRVGEGVANPPCKSLSNQVAVRVTFAHNSDQLDVSSRQILTEFARAMETPLLGRCNFLVVGHTDASGEAEYNRKLSERRSTAVKRFLISSRIEAERLHAIGKGESEPISSDPYAGENRRVQFSIASEDIF
jgi:outer membrane protein OmpA-like peptidoglycan-associated protein